MISSKKSKTAHNVLTYTLKGVWRSTVRRHYMRWRQEQEPPLPERCDNPDYWFHTHPLIWNGKPLKPILDHYNGNNTDNRTKNLRLLCPNCDSQNTDTRGGANKGRIEKTEDGFAIVARDGKRHHTLPVETGYYSASGGDAQFIVGSNPSASDDNKE